MNLIRRFCWIFFEEYRYHEPTEEQIQAEVLKMKEEQRQKRMFKTPPPLNSWFNPTTGETGNNQADIDRWHKEHYDWLPQL
jgi:hypothetical protein